MSTDVPALRVVHLLGGLRAYDIDAENVDVGTNEFAPKVRMKRPQYGQLYLHLERLRLQPIGVQFLTSPEDLNGLNPPDWQAWMRPAGFYCMAVEREWANVRSSYLAAGETDIGTLAGKVKTNLRLLNLRVRQLSDAYFATLRSRLTRRPGHGEVKAGKFSNMWGNEVDAAIHAYFSDAASLRDALAEVCWRVILQRKDRSVSSIGGLIRYAKGTDNALVLEILKETESGGWIKNLTDLRNEVVHVIPVGGMHEHSFIDLRMTEVGGGPLYRLHYPLTASDWSLREGISRGVDYSSEEAVHRSVRDYDAFSATSGDALEYAWRVSSRLADLADRIRKEAKLEGEIPHFTDADIVPGSFRTISHNEES